MVTAAEELVEEERTAGIGLDDPLTDKRVMLDEAVGTGVLAGPMMDTELVMGEDVRTGVGLWSPVLVIIKLVVLLTAAVTLAVGLTLDELELDVDWATAAAGVTDTQVPDTVVLTSTTDGLTVTDGGRMLRLTTGNPVTCETGELTTTTGAGLIKAAVATTERGTAILATAAGPLGMCELVGPDNGSPV